MESALVASRLSILTDFGRMSMDSSSGFLHKHVSLTQCNAPTSISEVQIIKREPAQQDQRVKYGGKSVHTYTRVSLNTAKLIRYNP